MNHFIEKDSEVQRRLVQDAKQRREVEVEAPDWFGYVMVVVVSVLMVYLIAHLVAFVEAAIV